MNTQENLLENFDDAERSLLSKRSLLILVFISLFIGIIDIIVVLKKQLIEPDDPGQLMDSQTKVAVFLFAIHFLVIPGISLLLSILFSLLPIKKKAYSKKYLSITVLLLLIMQVALLIMSLLDTKSQ